MDIQDLVFIVSPNTADLPHRKPASAGTPRHYCRAWGNYEKKKKHSVEMTMFQRFRTPCVMAEIVFCFKVTSRKTDRERS
jgi:hypothetical protein